MIKKGIIVITLAIIFLMLGSGFAFAKDKLKIGNEADFPPFSFKDSAGNIKGFDIDITNEICKRIDADCEIVVQEWSGIIPALKAGKFDLIISSMTINEERKKQLLFSNPYYKGGYAFVAKKGINFEYTAESMKGLRIAVQKNSTPNKWLREKFGDAITIKYHDSPKTIVLDLKANRLDAWCETRPAIYGSLMSKPEGKDYHFIEPALTDPKWFGQGEGIAARLGEDKLMEKVNKAIDEIYADGTFEKINAKYFPFSISAQ